jgi:hypothetical protein
MNGRRLPMLCLVVVVLCELSAQLQQSFCSLRLFLAQRIKQRFSRVEILGEFNSIAQIVICSTYF